MKKKGQEYLTVEDRLNKLWPAIMASNIFTNNDIDLHYFSEKEIQDELLSEESRFNNVCIIWGESTWRK